MRIQFLSFSVLPLGMAFSAALLWLAWQGPVKEAQKEVPDFAAITDVKVKKETFFEFMLPRVRRANDSIMAQRERLLALLSKIEDGNELDADNASWMQALATQYRITTDPLADPEARENLQKRVNAIPASLALAQAANESAWGTARFARNGNNYFGLWCWTRNCGMVPTRRDAEKKHEVATFDNVEAGVRYYLLTLNSHPAYKALRDRRERAFKNGEPVTGQALAEGLLRYSERRQEYVDEIRAMIRINQLQRFSRSELYSLSTASQP